MSQSQTSSSTNQQVNAPFRAKSAGVSLFTIIVIGFYYVSNLLSLLPSDESVPDGALSVVITTIVLVVIVEAALQIVLFIGAGRIENRNQRDDVVTIQASRNAYLLLMAGVFVTFGSMFAGFTPFEMGSTLLIAFLLAEIVKYGSQLVYYRRPA